MKEPTCESSEIEDIVFRCLTHDRPHVICSQCARLKAKVTSEILYYIEECKGQKKFHKVNSGKLGCEHCMKILGELKFAIQAVFSSENTAVQENPRGSPRRKCV